ncbi:hypothetical protein HA075_26560 [bacterium BFN5]|nr:hypothetical protein HA075_26560 [bacterium BFN5]
MGLRLLVNIRFQVLFPSPPGVLFPFPSRYYSLSVAKEYFALEGGPPCFPQGFSCLVVLWIDYGLSRDLGVTRKEAAQYIESYFKTCSGVKEFIDQIVKEAHSKGYVTTLFGRRRYLPDINSSNFNQRSFAERTAMNTPIQGTAADIIKKAMIDVYTQLRDNHLQSRILLQVHDELVLEVMDGEVAKVAEIVQQAMERAVQLSVPLTADVKIGVNWAQAK